MGSKKKQTVGYKYFGSGHFVLCHGPIDAITKIQFQDKDAFTSEKSSNQRIYINKPSLFGGDEQSGGIQGNVDLLFGRADQQKSNVLKRICGDLISAWRGVTSVVFDNVYIGTSPTFPESKWRVKRIHTLQNGEQQWYDEKAEIGAINYSDINKIAFILDDSGSMSGENISNMKAGVNNLLSGFANTETDILIQAINSGSRSYSNATTANIISAKSFVDNLSAGGGTSATAAYANVNSFFGNESDGCICITLSDGEMQEVDAAKAMIIGVFSRVKFVGLGMGTVGSLASFDNTGKAVRVVDAEGISTALNAIFYSEADLNPAHIIRECLTNTLWGKGAITGLIDDVSFKACADTLYTEGMGMSIVWSDSTSIKEFIDNILEHINGELYVDRITNLWMLKLIRDDYSVNDLIHLTESHYKSLTFERKTLAECINQVTVTYYDRERAKDSTITIQDVARIAQQGVVISQKIDYKGFTNSNLASRIALRELKSMSAELATIEFDVPESIAENWHKAYVFKLSNNRYGLSEAVFRVTEIKFGDGIDNTVSIKAIEDSFSSTMQAVVEYMPPVKSDISAKDAAAIAFEVPYIELVEQYGQDEIDAKLKKNPGLSFVGMAAVRPNNFHINASLYSNAGAGYAEEGTLDFCPSATLKNKIGYLDTAFEVENVAEFDLLKVNERIQLDDELLAFMSFDSTTNILTVKRGCFDTVPQKHAASARIYGWDNYSGLDKTEYLSGESVAMKALTLTGFDILELSKATPHSINCSARAIRPYPPANVQINAEYFPAEIETDLIITWADRNRVQQTGGGPLGWFESGVTTEDGVTYSYELVCENVILDSRSNISANTVTILASVLKPNKPHKLKLWSVRDGYESYQKFEHSFFAGSASLILTATTDGSSVTGNTVPVANIAVNVDESLSANMRFDGSVISGKAEAGATITIEIQE